MKERTYICCDLKSFYASVECIERGLNPLDTNLVVADLSRTEKTICLAVTPSLKAYGISGRARLFEVIQRVKEVNNQRQRNTPGRQFTGASSHDPEVRRNPSLALDYIVAPPRMAHYIDWSTRVYSVYLKHVAPEDIYPYSIDEVFIDATSYLQTYHLSAREFARKIILDILQTTGITAAAGIGTNLYLAKVAMDIGAKHVPADEYGVRIAELDEMGYRRSFWTHRPLTDFWRVGKGYAAKLEAHGLYTMGDIARCSIGKSTDYHNEELLYKLFGVNAELLIDHAWGWEPCTIADIKAYKPENKSIVSGQILQYPYPFEKARLVIQEMADALALKLVDKEYESLKAEVLKAIQGKSALPQDVLTEMLEDTRQKVLSTSERITTLTAELNDGNSKIEEMKAEFNRIVSWSKIFDESPMEVKKMICGYIIKKVSVFRDYRIKIEFNINVEQFLNGIDSIDECATYELPMAQ